MWPNYREQNIAIALLDDKPLPPPALKETSTFNEEYRSTYQYFPALAQNIDCGDQLNCERVRIVSGRYEMWTCSLVASMGITGTLLMPTMGFDEQERQEYEELKAIKREYKISRRKPEGMTWYADVDMRRREASAHGEMQLAHRRQQDPIPLLLDATSAPVMSEGNFEIEGTVDNPTMGLQSPFRVLSRSTPVPTPTPGFAPAFQQRFQPHIHPSPVLSRVTVRSAGSMQVGTCPPSLSGMSPLPSATLDGFLGPPAPSMIAMPRQDAMFAHHSLPSSLSLHPSGYSQSAYLVSPVMLEGMENDQVGCATPRRNHSALVQDGVEMQEQDPNIDPYLQNG